MQIVWRLCDEKFQTAGTEILELLCKMRNEVNQTHNFVLLIRA